MIEPPSRELLRGRELVAERAWLDAHEALARADAQAPLAVDDLWRWWRAASLSGNAPAAYAALERIYQQELETAPVVAARAAFWLGFRLMVTEPSRGQGWLARAERALSGVLEPCVERGYLEIPRVRAAFGAGRLDEALLLARQAAEQGERFADLDLCTFARQLQGRVLIRLGQLDVGFKLLDEAMLTVTAGELSPTVAGLVYCSAIDSCQGVLAFDRVRQWSDSLSAWCDAQPQLSIFTGACLVCRAEVLELGGRFAEALDEARRAAVANAETYGAHAAADAIYRQGEIHRLRGEVELAEACYREASEKGRDPQPGLALLRLAQGKIEAAVSALRRASATLTEPWARSRLLPALVEVLLANGAVAEARAAADELGRVAELYPTDALIALARRVRGAVLLAEGDAPGALFDLREAFTALQLLDAPYLVARTRVLLACACQAVGDEDGAQLEIDAARSLFEKLGAVSDVAHIDALAARARTGDAASGLSGRELEVLRLVASGKTNKLIARDLCLSEKTVDRHVSNILGKLNVPTRAAATAFAYEKKLV